MKELVIVVLYFVIFAVVDIATYAIFKVTKTECVFKALLMEGFAAVAALGSIFCMKTVPDSFLEFCETYAKFYFIGHVLVAVFLFLEIAKAVKARRLHKEVEEKLAPYAERGCRLVLLDKDSRDVVVVAKDGNERKIAMEEPLKNYFFFSPKSKELCIGGGVLHWHVKV